MHINKINSCYYDTNTNFTSLRLSKSRIFTHTKFLQPPKDNFTCTKIKAGCLGEKCYDLSKRVLDYAGKNIINHHYIEKGNGRFLPKLNPVTLPHVEPKGNSIFITNFVYPHGSIAGTSSLKDEIITGELWQCAGIAIVDKTRNFQTLLHINPYAAKTDNKKLIEYVMSHSKTENMKITIIPGFYDESDATVEFIISAIKSVSPDTKINFANFPPEVSDYERTVVLRNGELSCCHPKEVKKRKVNPKQNLLYHKPVYHKNNFILNSIETVWEKYASRFTEYLTFKYS